VILILGTRCPEPGGIRCPSCNAENPPTAKFCVECGTAFQAACAKCGFKNPPTAKFCQECGTGLSAPNNPPAAEASPPQPQELTGERRHLTVLFCDLAGSSGIAARLDPEEWRETVSGYHRAAAEAIKRFGGHVAKYLGDGVVAFFGYPQAHDNDAERAVRAGLAILESITTLNEQPSVPNWRRGLESIPVLWWWARRRQACRRIRRHAQYRGPRAGSGRSRLSVGNRGHPSADLGSVPG
jgi:ribosomal protein L40E